MALELSIKFTRSNDQLSLVATDLTGVYDVTTNPGGYGSPNPAVGDFVSFDITVTLPDPTTLLPGGTPVVINAFPSLPSNSNGTFTITNVDLGLESGTKLIDGVYQFDIIASTVGDEYEYSTKAVYSDIVACCIRTMTAEASTCGCSSDSDKIRNLVKGNMWLSVLVPYVDDSGTIYPSSVEVCGQYDKAAEILRELQKICNNSNCQGCGGC